MFTQRRGGATVMSLLDNANALRLRAFAPLHETQALAVLKEDHVHTTLIAGRDTGPRAHESASQGHSTAPGLQDSQLLRRPKSHRQHGCLPRGHWPAHRGTPDRADV